MLRMHGKHCICSKCDEMDCSVKSLEDYKTEQLVNELIKRKEFLGGHYTMTESSIGKWKLQVTYPDGCEDNLFYSGNARIIVMRESND